MVYILPNELFHGLKPKSPTNKLKANILKIVIAQQQSRRKAGAKCVTAQGIALHNAHSAVIFEFNKNRATILGNDIVLVFWLGKFFKFSTDSKQ